MPYCPSRLTSIRRATPEVMIGAIGVGGTNPIRIQSMTTSDTQDVAATVQQAIALAEVGCEIVRVTAPNVTAARCLKGIREQLTAAGFGAIPLVADIHFLPSAAMEAVEHVEKIRVNPGNYADKKKFTVREYSDSDYEQEIQRLHEAFSPLVKRCRELGRAMRIGTNHGSLSDRIMNRYGDTPLGRVDSALEFLRIAESHDYRQIMLSMKASNPKIMIQAYRLLVQRMAREGMHYPLHLGVTEAGDGEDGRIKSAIGIGSLLLDGLGDTIRVSLTEDSVYEIPVARALADKAMAAWQLTNATQPPPENDPLAAVPAAPEEAVDFYTFNRRPVAPLTLADGVDLGPEQPPRVLVRAPSIAALPEISRQLSTPRLKDNPAEGVLVPVETRADLAALPAAAAAFAPPVLGLLLAPALTHDDVAAVAAQLSHPLLLVRRFVAQDGEALANWASLSQKQGHTLALAVQPTDLAALGPVVRELRDASLIITLGGPPEPGHHAVGAYRELAAELHHLHSDVPLWIRNTADSALRADNSFLSKLLEASMLTGALLCDGLGDLVSIETEADAPRATRLVYNVLQGAGARITKTEFVACPSCGRTLFDLQTTTQRIREKTGHLKGVKIAIMGCIVNGPGEMADADFGYVGGAPGKINLYVGKTCVQYNLPQTEADDRLIALIKEHGKWVEPAPTPAA